MTGMETEVLIVGAGPVGLTLSIDLGKRGIRCILIEKNDAPLGYPKMERCNPRTMEIFRRLGLADTVRAAGYPPDWPMDTYLVFDLMRPPLFKMAHPTVAQSKARRDATTDGSMPLEPYQIISQYTLEPLLKSVAERIPNLAVRFGHELLSYTEEPDGVAAQVRKTSGETITIRAQYLVGCDGGSSVVRKQLGFKMEGEPHLLEMRQALFHCPELYDKVRAPRARHYHRIDDHWTLMIVQDSRKHFTLHAVVEKDEDMAALFEAIVGTPVKYEMVHCAKWVQRLLLAEHYQQGRVFIAGDAAHLVIPTGGLGMNTGVGDAIDISWKLAATLRGWGGPKLLQSYEAERRPIGAINVKASGGGTAGRMKWRAAYRPDIEDDTPSGRAALAEPADNCEGGGAKIIPRHRCRARLSLCRLSRDLRRARRARAEHRGICADKLARGAFAACLARARRDLGARPDCRRVHAFAARSEQSKMPRACEKLSARSVRLFLFSISIAKRRVASMASIIFWSGRICTWSGVATRCRRTRTELRAL